MHIYHLEDAPLTADEIARILDAFHVGRLLRHWELDRRRFLAETAHGLFGLYAATHAEWHAGGLENTATASFGAKHGIPRATGETDAQGRPIVVTHKLDRYFVCIEL